MLTQTTICKCALAALVLLCGVGCFGQSNIYSFSVHTRWTIGKYPAKVGLEGYRKNTDGSYAYVAAMDGSTSRGKTTDYTAVILGPVAFSVRLPPLAVALSGVMIILALGYLLAVLFARADKKGNEEAIGL